MDAVIVTHNSQRDLAQLLACGKVTAQFTRLIVVDNSSTDATCELADEAGLRVIRRGVNDGFGAAANVGATVVEGSSFALLNPDIAFPSSGIVEQAERLLADPSIGIVAPKLILPSGAIQDSARRVPSPFELVRRRTFATDAEAGAVRSETRKAVPWAVGACWFISLPAFQAVGGFDTRYRLYFEDVDCCVRMARSGYSTVYDPSMLVEHRHAGESRKSITSKAMRLHLRSAARFYVTHPRAIFNRSAFDVP